MNKLSPITRYSATLILAYCQYYSCKHIPGRSFPNVHLRQMALWIGCPNPNLRSIRQHPSLAAHIALLHAANLLAHNQTYYYLTPLVSDWLTKPAKDQLQTLIDPIIACRFTATIESFRLVDTIPIDMIAYLHQQLLTQLQQPPPETETASWQTITTDTWNLCLPPKLEPKHLFHLLQIGCWSPVNFDKETHPQKLAREPKSKINNGQVLNITPLTIAQASRRGYSLTHITFLLEKTTGIPLSTQQQQQLVDWYRRQDSYQMRSITLLSTKQPQQLAQIIDNGNLRPHIKKQISPRHAIVSPALQPSLQKWAARRGYMLNAPAIISKTNKITPTGYQWLGLKLLTSLGYIIPLPYPPPLAELETMNAHISTEEAGYLSMIADQIIANLRDAIHGRDAFFPSQKSVPADWVQIISRIINAEETLEIMYQPLGDIKPSHRRIQPLRLEERGALFYIYAYCYRAEMNLTFRLDRITKIMFSSDD